MSRKLLLPKVVKADKRYDDMVALISAIKHYHPQQESVLLVGGEKFGLIRFDENGNYADFKSNTSCAAGTGSFIEEQAQKLGCPLANYASRTEHKRSPIASDRCTVFMERDINHYLNEGYAVDEVLAAVLHSICENISWL